MRAGRARVEYFSYIHLAMMQKQKADLPHNTNEKVSRQTKKLCARRLSGTPDCHISLR
jgi:hypothetical protein